MATEIIDYLEVIHETDKAVLLRCKRGDVWIPTHIIISSDDECIEIPDTFDVNYKPKKPDLSEGFGAL